MWIVWLVAKKGEVKRNVTKNVFFEAPLLRSSFQHRMQQKQKYKIHWYVCSLHFSYGCAREMDWVKDQSWSHERSVMYDV